MMEQEGKSMETQTKLLPCPFCGSEGTVNGYPYDRATQFMVECAKCFCAVGKEYDRDAMPDFEFNDEDAAREAWNTRTPDAAKDAAILALKGAVHADVAEFSRDSATLEAQSEQIRVLREALENPSAHTHCCFCGTYNVDDPKGYAGERACHACGHGGQGEADLPQMAANAWGNRRPAALASTAPVAEKKEGK